MRKVISRMRAKNKRIVRYKRPLNINIGVIIFAMIFIYIVVCTFLYFTREKVSIYEVTNGNSEKQMSIQTTGIALRNEIVSYAPSSGYINYYVQEGTRVSLDTTLYSIDESGTITQLLEEAAQNDSTLTADNVSSIKKVISKYSVSYMNEQFSDVYQFQYDLNSSLIECVNLNAIESINQKLNESGNNAFAINKSNSSGIVQFYMDGYEGITVDTITEELFNRENYIKNTISSATLVENGSAIYKTINDEAWSIVIPLTEEQAVEYEKTKIVSIELLSEDISTSGYFSIKKIGEKSYGVINLKRFMMKYASDRFVDIRVIADKENGLKIPITSVAEKEFYTVPEEYRHLGGNNNELGFSREIIGTDDIEFITPEIFATVDGVCYIDKKILSENDVLIKTDSQSKYVVVACGTLKGVYNVNTGYTTFRYIEILSEKKGYYIIKSGSTRGISLYDYIVLNASLVDDKSVIFH